MTGSVAFKRSGQEDFIPDEGIPQGIDWAGLGSDEAYLRLEAEYNGYSPNLDWLKRSLELSREVREARLASRFED